MNLEVDWMKADELSLKVSENQKNSWNESKDHREFEANFASSGLNLLDF